MGDDVAAQVEYGQLQQLLLDQEQTVEHAAGAAVAISERVDGFELVMSDGHADERIQLPFVMEEALPVGQQLAQQVFSCRWGIDHFAGAIIGERRPRYPANVHLLVFDDAAYFDRGSRGERPLFQRLKTMAQSGSITQRFLGGAVRLAIGLCILKQLVGGGDDILDFGAVLGFQQRDGIDQHRLVGDQAGRLFQLCQGGSRRDALLENRTGFQVYPRGQWGKLVVGAVRAPAFRS